MLPSQPIKCWLSTTVISSILENICHLHFREPEAPHCKKYPCRFLIWTAGCRTKHKEVLVLLQSYYIDWVLASACDSCAQAQGMCPPTSCLGGTLPDTSSPISSRNVVGTGQLIWRRGLQWLLTILRGRLRQRVSEEENGNSAIVSLALRFYCKVH